MAADAEHLRVRAGRVNHLRNSSCPYCGGNLKETGSTKEHVVGRRSVPLGSLHQQWNLILRACRDCNRLKSALEDELSAVTMHPPLIASAHIDTAITTKDMTRKARGSAGLRKDRRPQRITIGGRMTPGVSISVGLVAPPSTSSDHIEALAHLQIAAFFYWLTYDEERRSGGYWRGKFQLINCAGTTDWGNPLQSAFSNTISRWSPRLVVDTAQGFFKAAIRRDPAAECWGWAIEWNKNYRVIGFFGDEAVIEAHRARLPLLETSVIGTSNDGDLRVRVEWPLPPHEDLMFTIPPPDSTG